jgi:tRNA U34 5-carboxymethylaminomethyl modifying GTPase MnmE/TrmE
MLEASLLVHVLDVTHPNAFQQAKTVHSIIAELGADELPMITALNKVDRLGDDVSPEQLRTDMGLSDNYVPISAQTGVGVDLLTDRIAQALARAARLRHPLFIVRVSPRRVHRLVSQRLYCSLASRPVGHSPRIALPDMWPPAPLVRERPSPQLDCAARPMPLLRASQSRWS